MLRIGSLTSVSPLEVLLDGDQDVAPVEVSAVHSGYLNIGQRVLCEVRDLRYGGNQVLLTGIAGGSAPPVAPPSFPPKASTRTLTADQAFSASAWTTLGLNSSAATAQTADVGWPATGTAQVNVTGIYLVQVAMVTTLQSAITTRIMVAGNVAAITTQTGTSAGGAGAWLTAVLSLTAGQQVYPSFWSASAGTVKADSPSATQFSRLTLQRLATT